MKRLACILALFSISVASGAYAMPMMTPIVLRDLDDGQHSIPHEWRDGGIIIFGFEHDARDAMDQWATALSLQDGQAWFESPVIGAVPALVRPMIRGAMRSRYTGDRRQHVAPIFGDADAVNQMLGNHGAIVVLVVGASGAIVARADGAASVANVALIRARLPS